MKLGRKFKTGKTNILLLPAIFKRLYDLYIEKLRDKIVYGTTLKLQTFSYMA